MKTRIGRIACVMLQVVCLLALGCNDRQATVNPERTLEDPETQIGMSLPSDAVVFSFSDGSGKDATPEEGNYTWTVFSPSPIKMPPTHASGVEDYLDFSDPEDLASSVEYVESRMRRRKISQPQAAFNSIWEDNIYDFRGKVVQSSEGDYLVIHRFRKETKSRKAVAGSKDSPD